MARPFKRRRICGMPGCRRFQPGEVHDEAAQVVMTVDEYECIRLMDFEQLTQAECAAQMQVARTTVQSMYEAARHKLAQCLVEGRPLLISGGHYELCMDGMESCGRVCHCPRRKSAKACCMLETERGDGDVGLSESFSGE